LGLLVAFPAVRYFIQAQPIELPVGASVFISFPAQAFTVTVSAIAVLFFAAVPAWTASEADICGTAQESERLPERLAFSEKGLWLA
jgi:hypothetical protein